MKVTAISTDTLHEKALGFQPEAVQRFEDSKAWMSQGYTWVMPLSDGMVHMRAVHSWMQNVHPPMNQGSTQLLTTERMEVGEAYNWLFEVATERASAADRITPDEGFLNLNDSLPFVLTTEHDNIIPPDAIKDLMVAIYTCPDCGKGLKDIRQNPDWLCPDGHHGYDAVSGLYMTKCDPPQPMAYGNPANGPDDFTPQSVKQAIADKATIEVNGIAMGCAVWRKGLFAKVSKPWFVTRDGGTQDLYFCKKAKEEAGARFGVNCKVRVGHMDYRTKRCY